MNRVASTFSFILILVFLVVGMTSCENKYAEEETTIFDQYYVFEPKTLLDSLQNANTNTFTLVDKRPEFLPVNQQLPFPWHQADYFNIATTLYNSIGKPLQDWQLNNMDFRSHCNKIDEGFQNGRFEFFTVVKENESESRLSRFVDIDTRGNFVHVNETKYDPNIENWAVVDLEKLKISAEQAFQIAEQNGGKEIRESVNNDCAVSLVLAPDNARYKGWAVIYTQDSGTPIFHIQVDPYTGEIRSP